jgi:UDP-glucose 4-epimerase
MTRFLLSLNKAVDTVFAAIKYGKRGETFVPKVAAAKITDVAKVLMGDKDLPIIYTGIRPGEKVHEIMVSEEECFRTIERGDYYAILPVLPELREQEDFTPALSGEYSSKDKNISIPELRELLSECQRRDSGFLIDSQKTTRNSCYRLIEKKLISLKGKLSLFTPFHKVIFSAPVN